MDLNLDAILQPCITGKAESGVCGNRVCAQGQGVMCCGECPEREDCNSACGWLDEPEPPVIRVWVKEPGKAPEERRVPNTLKALQELVDGYIETVTVPVNRRFAALAGADGEPVRYIADVVIICNEEGRLIGYPSNVKISGVRFVGTIVIACAEGEEFADAPEERILRELWPNIWRTADRKEAETDGTD